MAPPPDDHDCGWKSFAVELQEQLAEVKAKMAAMERRLLGPKSEKLPKTQPVEREVAKKRPVDPATTQAKRRKDSELRATRVVTEDVTYKVPETDCCCPRCGRTKLRSLGEGKTTFTLDYVPGYFRRKRHIREVLSCACGGYVITAPGPDHSVEGARYGDGFRAHVVVSKCADSIPLYRLARQLARLGIPVARSTLTDLFHQTAAALKPLSDRLLELIAAAEVVQADETSLKMQKPNKRGFVWTFLADNLIAYRFSGSRSGEMPVKVLGASQGTLVVDMYTGYNEVTGTGRRRRAACLAHARRRFFEALAYAPEARLVLDLIRDVYVVEHDAKAAGIAQSPEHTKERRVKTAPIMARIKALLEEHSPRHAPKSPMGQAIGYTLKNWGELTRFLDDARIPPDNNRSESALRVVALGRRNFLFVGHEDAGANIAGLYSLVATCDANGVNPLAYLSDVLGRLGSTTNVDDLLPHKWQPRA